MSAVSPDWEMKKHASSLFIKIVMMFVMVAMIWMEMATVT